MLLAPLLLARNAVPVAVHLRARAVLQEECRLGAGRHLRAVRAGVAGVGCLFGFRQSHFPGSPLLLQQCRRGSRLRPLAVVAVSRQNREHQHCQYNEYLCHAAIRWPRSAGGRCVRCARHRPRRGPCWRHAGQLHPHRFFLALRVELHLERKHFIHDWRSAPRVLRNMHEDVLPALRRRDEAEPSVVGPRLELACESHSLMKSEWPSDRPASPFPAIAPHGRRWLTCPLR
jgi:hypothetical protein